MRKRQPTRRDEDSLNYALLLNLLGAIGKRWPTIEDHLRSGESYMAQDAIWVGDQAALASIVFTPYTEQAKAADSPDAPERARPAGGGDITPA